MAQLADAKGRLKAVEDKVAMLNEQFDGAVAEKGELEAKANQCQTRLSNAGKLLGGLG